MFQDQVLWVWPEACVSCVSRKVPRRTEKEAEEVPWGGIQETDHVQQLRGYLPLLAVQASAIAWDRIVEGTERSNKHYIQRENDVQGFDFKTET